MCLPTSTRESLTKPTTCVSDAAVRQMCPASATPGSPVPDDGRPRPAPDLPQRHLVEDPRVEPHGDELHVGEYRADQRYRERDGVGLHDPETRQGPHRIPSERGRRPLWPWRSEPVHPGRCRCSAGCSGRRRSRSGAARTRAPRTPRTARRRARTGVLALRVPDTRTMSATAKDSITIRASTSIAAPRLNAGGERWKALCNRSTGREAARPSSAKAT